MTPERRQLVNYEHISQLFLVFLYLTLNMQLPVGKVTEPLRRESLLLNTTRSSW